MRSELRPLIAAGALMGIGLGGFFDGILFHQILGLHQMLSNVIPRTTVVNEEINMFWDGIFHAFCYVAVAVALYMLWKLASGGRVPLSGITYFGSLWLGWGFFNLVEGIVDHQILQLHHVYQAAPDRFLFWDLVFQGSGLLFLFIGWRIIRRTPDHLAISQSRLRFGDTL